MDISEVHCELLTKKNVHLMIAALNDLDDSDILEIDTARLEHFLEHPENLAFIARNNNEVCGFIYGYSLMSLTDSPQLFVYSVDILTRYQTTVSAVSCSNM